MWGIPSPNQSYLQIHPNCDYQKYDNEIKNLKTNLKAAEHANNLLVTKYEEAVADSEVKATLKSRDWKLCSKIVRKPLETCWRDKVIEELKTKNSNLETRLLVCSERIPAHHPHKQTDSANWYSAHSRNSTYRRTDTQYQV